MKQRRKRLSPAQISDLDWLSDSFRDALAEGDTCFSESQLKENILKAVESEIDRKLPLLKDGQALGIIFRLEVINKDFSIHGSPNERFSPEANQWRENIFKRDNYKCRECQSTDGLQAHHIKSWAEYPNLRLNLDNGVTLCRECHVKKHPTMEKLIRSSYVRKKKAIN